MDISRDQDSFANISPGEHFNPMSWGMIRNQRSKIHLTSVEVGFNCQGPGGLLEKSLRSTVE